MKIHSAARAVLSLSLLFSSLPPGLRAEEMPDLSSAFDSLRPAVGAFKTDAAARAAGRKPVKPAPRPEEPEDETCGVCWSSNFKPLNEKARVVQKWEKARVELKATTAVVGTISIFVILFPPAWDSLDEGTKKYIEQKRALDSLRSQALALGGLAVQNGVLKVKLVPGTDYTK